MVSYVMLTYMNRKMSKNSDKFTHGRYLPEGG